MCHCQRRLSFPFPTSNPPHQDDFTKKMSGFLSQEDWWKSANLKGSLFYDKIWISKPKCLGLKSRWFHEKHEKRSGFLAKENESASKRNLVWTFLFQVAVMWTVEEMKSDAYALLTSGLVELRFFYNPWYEDVGDKRNKYIRIECI